MNEKLTPHPQADILIAYAKGKEIQGRLLGREWETITNPLDLINEPTRELRVKTEMMVLAGHEFPMPVREPLEDGQMYFIPKITGGALYRGDTWGGYDIDFDALNRGLIQLTVEGAIAQAKAMIASVGGEV